MIGPDDLRVCRDASAVIDLFRRLGYPVEPIDVDATEWRRAGIEIPAARSFKLLSRFEHFDLFFAERCDEQSAEQFLSDYAKYNLLTKSAIINYNDQKSTLTLSVIDGGGHRRASVSCQDPTPHAVDRLNLLTLGERVDPARLFDRALDRESVARLFFSRFRSAVKEVAASLAVSCAGETEEAVADEALLILSRLLFLCFVQEKGWLNGERRFLVDRADEAMRSGASFCGTVLWPLFFGCLNTPADRRDEIACRLGAIPYLNGGLFEPSAFERRNPLPAVSNELMRRILEDVFEKFDFTVDETDPAGTRVDPEMLGKVFESLMAEDERAASGSFYTPKAIVDTLTGRGVTEWVSGADESIRDDLLQILSGQAPSRRTLELAPDIIRRLETITVLDPSCGSGAFLLSALHVIERLIVALAGTRDPMLRQRIVERSLYGVDLKREAVRLCELRLWLAIVAGTEMTLAEVRPLPNLDRNILQGNSLLSPLDFLGNARADIYRDWVWGIRAQKDLVERYRCASREERPSLYRLLCANDRRLATDLLSRAVEADEQQLQAATTPRRDLFGDAIAEDVAYARMLHSRLEAARQALGRVEASEVDFFSFDVHFAHVMAAGGFDLVAGNPPWVRNGRIDPVARHMYRQRYRLFSSSRTGAPFHQPDLSVAFVERSLTLAAPGGMVAMLLPAKIMNAAYASPLREFVTEEASVAAIVDWTDERRRHFTADTFPLGLLLRREQARHRLIEVTSASASFSIDGSELSVDGPGSEWSLAPPEVSRLLRTLRDRFPSLEEQLERRPIMGVKTGDNHAFFLELQAVESGWFTSAEGIAIPTEFICRAARGRDVRRWSLRESHWMLWPPAAGWRQYPPWLLQLAVHRKVEPDRLKLSYIRAEHVGIKVAWKDVSRGMAAVVLPETAEVSGHTFPLIPNQTLYSVDVVTLDQAYAISGLLNSVVVDALLLAVAERAKDDHYRYFGRTVSGIPFPLPKDGSDAWQRLVRSSRNAHRVGSASIDHERSIAKLFGMTTAELEVLRAFVARRLDTR